MSKKKPIVDKGIIIYYDYDFIFNFLTDEEVGKTIRLLLETKDTPTLNPTDNSNINNAYNYIASRILEYKKSKGLAVEWGKQGGNPTLKGKDNGGDKTGDKLIEKKRIENKINKPNRKETTKEKFINSIEEDNLKPLLKKWLEHRKDLKEIEKWEYQYKRLKSFANPKEVVEHSIGNNYQGLYAPKATEKPKQDYKYQDGVPL